MCTVASFSTATSWFALAVYLPPYIVLTALLIPVPDVFRDNAVLMSALRGASMQRPRSDCFITSSPICRRVNSLSA